MSNLTKILIIEDEKLLSDVYATVLSMNHFAIEVAHNGLVGLTKLRSFKPQLILLDLLMPTMDGITFLENLTDEDLAQSRIIVYSNLFDSETIKRVKELGAEDIVLKSSLTPSQLVSLMRSKVT